MTEHIERARALNRQAYDDIDQGQLDAAKDALSQVPKAKALGLLRVAECHTLMFRGLGSRLYLSATARLKQPFRKLTLRFPDRTSNTSD